MTYVPPRAELNYCSCLHAKACLAQHLHCKPMYADAWDELGCGTCRHYKDRDDCPMDMSGTMRCGRECVR